MKIVCFVDEGEEKVFKEKLPNGAVFTKTSSELSSNIEEGNIQFYILDKYPRDAEVYLIDLFACNNIGVSPYSFKEIFEIISEQ